MEKEIKNANGWEFLNKVSSPKPKKKKGKKEKEPEEVPIEKIVAKRAAAQIIARAEEQADALDMQNAQKVTQQLEYQAKCRVEGKFKLVFTGGSYVKIFPDGSKEIEIPPALRGKIFLKYRDFLCATDTIDE